MGAKTQGPPLAEALFGPRAQTGRGDASNPRVLQPACIIGSRSRTARICSGTKPVRSEPQVPSDCQRSTRTLRFDGWRGRNRTFVRGFRNCCPASRRLSNVKTSLSCLGYTSPAARRSARSLFERRLVGGPGIEPGSSALRGRCVTLMPTSRVGGTHRN